MEICFHLLLKIVTKSHKKEKLEKRLFISNWSKLIPGDSGV